MNKVLLTGRLTRDPEMRSLASGKAVTTFSVATNEFLGAGQGEGRVPQDRHLGPPGRDLRPVTSARASRSRSRAGSRPGPGTTTGAPRHWKTEIVATHVEMLSGRRKKDYAAESGRQRRSRPRPRPTARAAEPTTRPPRSHGRGRPPTTRRSSQRPDQPPHPANAATDRRRLPLRAGLLDPMASRSRPGPGSGAAGLRLGVPGELEERHGEDHVDEHQQRALEPVRSRRRGR